MKRHVVFAALLASALPVGLAMAHGGGAANEARREGFKAKFDTNKDGALDEAERTVMREKLEAKHEARRAEMLKRFDADKNGTLDETERNALHVSLAAERFAELDTNRDGSLSLAEFQAGGHFGFHGRRGSHR